MNPEKQRMAIAKACKIVRPTCDRIGGCLHELNPTYRCKCDNDFDAIVPDYQNDLNAMCKAEQSLDLEKRRTYADMLVRVVCWKDPNTLTKQIRHSPLDDTSDLDQDFALYNASAKQRAEAFLRTIEKWEE